ncbi:uncharacterized protein LOC131804166 [Musca domestica]|uniref:Uncharacterized protein LOC131804166 n=1 Tax=Musca domestica TaxID=7370 RepID=A0ABM3VA19_MUSDO|nr:uncharacterized protein LOC131804166 [Musca domestica]
MVTHGSSYELMRNLKLLNEPSINLQRDDHLQLIRQNLRKYIKEAYEKNQHAYNLRTRPRAIDIGETVFRRNFSQSNLEKSFNAKLSPVFIKAKVKEKLGNLYYVLEDEDGKHSGTYHSKDIRS